MATLIDLKKLAEETKGASMTSSNYIKMLLLGLELHEKGIKAVDIQLENGSYLVE